MPANLRLASVLYRLARAAMGIKVVTSFDVKKWACKYMNKPLGRHVLRRGYFGSRGGIFSKLWKPPPPHFGFSSHVVWGRNSLLSVAGT